MLFTLDDRACFGHLLGWEMDTNFVVYVPHLNRVISTPHVKFPDWPVIQALTFRPIGSNPALPESRSLPALVADDGANHAFHHGKMMTKGKALYMAWQMAIMALALCPRK